jgi:hypothetical protein
VKVTQSKVVTDAAPGYPGVLDELVPAAWHHVEQCDLKQRLSQADHAHRPDNAKAP